MKLVHYLKSSSNAGGANGYISHFLGDNNNSFELNYLSTDVIKLLFCAKKSPRRIVFHRSDGILLKLLIKLRNLFLNDSIKITQTFHNPVLPFTERIINQNSSILAFDILLSIPDFLCFLYSILIADDFYFASPNSIESYKKIGFICDILDSKIIRFFPTLLSKELFPAQVKTIKQYKDQDHVSIGFLGRESRVKGDELFKDLSRIYSTKYSFYASWSPANKTCSTIIRMGRINRWDFLDKIDVLVVPNLFCYYDLVLLEALSYGCPVLATNVGGAKDIEHPLLHKVSSKDLIDNFSYHINLLLKKANHRDETPAFVSSSYLIRQKFDHLF